MARPRPMHHQSPTIPLPPTPRPPPPPLTTIIRTSECHYQPLPTPLLPPPAPLSATNNPPLALPPPAVPQNGGRGAWRGRDRYAATIPLPLTSPPLLTSTTTIRTSECHYQPPHSSSTTTTRALSATTNPPSSVTTHHHHYVLYSQSPLWAFLPSRRYSSLPVVYQKL